ncbi:MAG: DUF1236 domain-containing protein [Mesorhizobium sp.]|jgi:Protein of unknown function (DUF1236)|nr:DUF1236 domain-containing protein [Mesorhizobium sp.]
MKPRLMTVTVALLFTAGIGAASADSVVVKPADETVVTHSTTIVKPEEQTIIREYVHKNPLASIKLPGVELNLGSRLPDTVELREVPNVKYRYTVIDGRTVLVDPETHEIVQVLDSE